MSSNYNRYNEDDDDFGFGNREKSSYSRDDQNELAELQKKIGQKEEESLESTYRALRSLNEAQETGTKTAAELVRQGEQLDNIEEKLDDIDNTLSSTQKNINQIKSIFGGFKNRFLGGSKSSNNIKEKEKKELEKKKAQSISKSSSFNTAKPSAEHAIITGSDREKEINNNLDQMSLGLSALNSLARDMKFELERQDPMIQRITKKSESTHARIEDQDRQMKKIK